MTKICEVKVSTFFLPYIQFRNLKSEIGFCFSGSLESEITKSLVFSNFNIYYLSDYFRLFYQKSEILNHRIRLLIVNIET